MDSHIQEYLRDQVNAVAESSNGSANSGDAEQSKLELKTMVRKWSEMDNQVKRMARLGRAYNVMKKDYEVKILEFMKENSIEQLNTKEAMIYCNTKTKKKKIHKDVMRDKICQVIDDPETRKKILDIMNSVKDDEVSVSLKKLCLE